MKINFKEFQVYTNLDKTESTTLNIAKELADGIYKTAQGVAGYSVALKIYNAIGEEEYTDEEFDIIMKYANTYGTPFFVDALNNLKSTDNVNPVSEDLHQQLG